MLVVLLLIIFAIIDFGRLLFVSQSMKAASREGARSAAVRTNWGPENPGTGTTVAKATNDAASAAAALAGGSLDYSGTSSVGTFTRSQARAATPVTTPLCNATNAAAGQSVQVTVTSGFRWFTPVGIFSSNVNSVSASTTMRCE